MSQNITLETQPKSILLKNAKYEHCYSINYLILTENFCHFKYSLKSANAKIFIQPNTGKYRRPINHTAYSMYFFYLRSENCPLANYG